MPMHALREYHLRTTAFAAPCAMALLRRFSIRRVVLSVVVGVIITTTLDFGPQVIGRAKSQAYFNFGREGGWVESKFLIDGVAYHAMMWPADLRDMGLVMTSKPTPLARGTDRTHEEPPHWLPGTGELMREQMLFQAFGVSVTGVPLRSIASESVQQSFTIEQVPALSWRRGEFRVHHRGRSGSVVYRVMVTHALLNIAFFTFITWTLLTGFAAARRWRRRSRGACFACGYVLGAASTCPECGTTARPVSAGETPFHAESTEGTKKKTETE